MKAEKASPTRLSADTCDGLGDGSASEQTSPTDSEFSDVNALSSEVPASPTFEGSEGSVDHDVKLLEESLWNPIALRRGRRTCAGKADGE